MKILEANVAASIDRPQLSLQDRRRLEHYARQTAFGYCKGCSRICESALSARVPVGQIMRCLMYDQAYGKYETAAECFRNIDSETRFRLRQVDYVAAERRCPQGMPIARLMHEASVRFA